MACNPKVASTDEGLDVAIDILLSPGHELQTQLASLNGKTVLLRADLNLPLGKDRSISDPSRLDAVLPTIRMLATSGAKVGVRTGRCTLPLRMACSMSCAHATNPQSQSATTSSSNESPFSLLRCHR